MVSKLNGRERKEDILKFISLLNCQYLCITKHKSRQEGNITIRVDKALKERFCALCKELGLTTTTAITLLMRAVIREKKIPFEISAEDDSIK